jgi:hypothetical protein
VAGHSACEGWVSVTDSHVSVTGEAVDLDASDGEPGTCVFTLKYEDGTAEYYTSTTSSEGSFQHAFTARTDPAELIVQACLREATGMLEWTSATRPCRVRYGRADRDGGLRTARILLMEIVLIAGMQPDVVS